MLKFKGRENCILWNVAAISYDNLIQFNILRYNAIHERACNIARNISRKAENIHIYRYEGNSPVNSHVSVRGASTIVAGPSNFTRLPELRVNGVLTRAAVLATIVRVLKYVNVNGLLRVGVI